MVKTAAWSILPIWLLAIAAVVVIRLSPSAFDEWTLWIPVACGVCVVLALALQVATAQPDGYVARASLAASGIIVVFAVASLAFALSGTGPFLLGPTRVG
ncbi:MAG: hypothetical protein J7480_00360 [Microbacteriaceae bacterium]|nr:hypothetical protein [Microbacteriaceae bacterium]